MSNIIVVISVRFIAILLYIIITADYQNTVSNDVHVISITSIKFEMWHNANHC